MPSARQQALNQYRDLIESAKLKGKEQVNLAMKALALEDLYFLLVFVLRQDHFLMGPEYKQDWLFDRCREVQAEPDGCLDLWAREHYKSTIVTYGLTIFDILHDPEITVCILSVTRPIAKAFLGQLKRELEANSLLKSLFPEVLWENPDRQAPKWSENEGILVKRRQNPKENTVEAYGLVDGQPTSRHYGLIIYDDIVTEETVRSMEMMDKATKSWELSLNLSREGGRMRAVGTIYHAADTYSVIRNRQSFRVRHHPATDDGTAQGEPVLFTRDYLGFKRQGMSSYVFSCQMLLNPKADAVVGFNEEDLRTWPGRNWKNLNIYLLVDPSSSKKKINNDWTYIDVVGLGPDENYYWIDGVRDRLKLLEKAKWLVHLHRRYKPVAVGYEEYGMQADIEAIQNYMDDQNYRFDIIPLGGHIAKPERIGWLEPLFQGHRYFLPPKIVRENHQGEHVDLVEAFVREEFNAWPYCLHDDMLDCKSRILDPKLGAQFPALEDNLPLGDDERRNRFDPLRV